MGKMDRQDCLIMIQIKLKVKNIQSDLSLNLIMLIPLIRYHEENFKMQILFLVNNKKKLI